MVNGHNLSTELQHWATAIRARGLVEVALPILDVLQVWGFVGSQVLWMIAPFVGEERLATLAETLDSPETLLAFRQCLSEGEA